MELEKIRPKVIERDHKKCILCGAPYEEVHHIKYRSAGGKNNIENLCCLCWHCHRMKRIQKNFTNNTKRKAWI